jgi:hypothetical protein
VILTIAIELGGAQPVLQRELDRVPDAEPPLLGAADEKQAPSDQNAWPPRLLRFSCSTTRTRHPAFTSSWMATRPARPAPTTITSGSSMLLVCAVSRALARLLRGLANVSWIRSDTD